MLGAFAMSLQTVVGVSGRPRSVVWVASWMAAALPSRVFNRAAPPGPLLAAAI